jgi:hypothetical protein
MATSNPADFKVKNGLVVTTTATFLSTVNSTSTTTGGAIHVGGVAIAKDLWVGGNTNIRSTTSATNTTSGALQVVGGVGIQGDVYARNIYSNGVLIGTNSSSATTSTNLTGGQAGYVPYQSAPNVTTLTNKLVFDGSYLQINSGTVLTTSSVIGQVGISVASTSTGSVYLAFIPGMQGLTADFGLLSDTTGAVTFDWGTL